jgi:hypothetical protein
MPDEVSIQINTKQPHTQSPSAVVGYLGESSCINEAGNVRQDVLNDRQICIPTIRVHYHPDPASATGWLIKFVQLSKLKDGWNGYAAPAPSEKAIALARSFVDILLKEKYEPKRLAPSAVGGVAVTQRSNNKKVFVEFFNDGTIYALFSDGSSEPVSEEIRAGYQAFKALVKRMRDDLNA